LISELLDEYKETDEQQKELLVNEFINRLWNSNYTYKTYKKYYTYIVKDDLLHNRMDLIELFNKYNMIEFAVCRSFYDKKLTPFDYIRIHINNMFGYLTDQNVYLSKQYYQLLLIPKHEYFSTINKLKTGELVDCAEIKNNITSALSEAEKEKEQSINKKLNISWKEYKKLIELYIRRLFNNYIPMEEYESKYGWEMHVNVDGWSEDNYIVKYFSKSLTGYLRNYVRDSLITKKRCSKCNKEVSNKNKFCHTCSEINRKEKRILYNKKYYSKIKNNQRYLSE
jgi:hypothetical protein